MQNNEEIARLQQLNFVKDYELAVLRIGQASALAEMRAKMENEYAEDRRRLLADTRAQLERFTRTQTELDAANKLIQALRKELRAVIERAAAAEERAKKAEEQKHRDDEALQEARSEAAVAIGKIAQLHMENYQRLQLELMQQQAQQKQPSQPAKR